MSIKDFKFKHTLRVRWKECDVQGIAYYGSYIDFIDVGVGGFRWYTFNIADSAVTIGVILYLLYSLVEAKPELIEKDE